MAGLEIHQFLCRTDNYGVIIRDPATGAVAAIDAPNGDQVQAALDDKGWTLTHIFTTHHHHDHTDGHLQLKAASGCQIIGPKDEEELTPGIDKTVCDGDTFTFGSYDVRVIDTRGHTVGHVTYWIPEAKVAFAGDTLFAMGCGKVRDGNYESMWRSLEKLRQLPPETRVYCGHEYTCANAEFALTIEPQNEALNKRYDEVKAMRAAGQPTLPTTISAELETNPFLRPDSPAIRANLALLDAPDWRVCPGSPRAQKPILSVAADCPLFNRRSGETMADPTADELIARFQLAPHPEGGFYRETHRDQATLPGGRACATAIYFLLTRGQISHWHRVDATEIWHWYAGAQLELTTAPPTTAPLTCLLGPPTTANAEPQRIVPAGHWQSARTLGDFTLCRLYRFTWLRIFWLRTRPSGLPPPVGLILEDMLF